MGATGSPEALARLISRSGDVLVLTGAGISTPSGIPDFRTPGKGLWENVDPMSVAHIDVLERDPSLFWAFYSERFTTLGEVRPNRAHEILVELEKHGLISGVVTQNVDRLHGMAGTLELVELHGSIDRSPCTGCERHWDLEEVRRRVAAAADGIPLCDCGSMIRPGVVLFGEMLPQDALERAGEMAAQADLVICIGSSLEVHPAAGLPLLTLAAGGALAILTEGDTPLDPRAAVRLRGDVVDELEDVLAALN